MNGLIGFPNLNRVVDGLLAIWPEHESYCKSHFVGKDAAASARMNVVAGLVLAIMGDKSELYYQDYKWMCGEFLKEELYFRRNRTYRLSKFDQVFNEIYGNPEYMSRYVRGILITQLIWKPHAEAFDIFCNVFLKKLPLDSNYMEVGPGPGLFLYFAAKSMNIAKLEAWDISASSIAETRSALSSLGVKRDITVVEQDVMEAPPRQSEFDAIVISEVLEHLERPEAALQSLRSALKSGGLIFINVPINSPAPDHIYIWRTTGEFSDFVTDQGYEIESFYMLPMTGVTLEDAVRKRMSISCVVIGRKP